MAAKKAQATKTVNPLHFEDLEPRRFEDLVRQLAYGFKSWRVLEPTGLLGDDEGTDIYGVEVDPEESAAERRWRFQCKRYKRLSPKAVREVVNEVVPDPKSPPHGIVIAAACNVTSDAILAFHEEAKKVGVTESHLWSKAKLEDLLFRSENDHLLFAYFGISLRTKRQSELAAIRHAMTVKKKLLSAVGDGHLEDFRFQSVVLRDVLDATYPRSPLGEGLARSWQVGRTVGAGPSHFLVELRSWIGWRKADGTWDVDEETRELIPLHELERDQTQEERAPAERLRRERVLLEEAVPEQERTRVVLVGWVPYSRVLEVDPLGHPGIAASHVFCEFTRGEDGPYDELAPCTYGTFEGLERLNEAKRDASLFVSLRERTDLSEAAWERRPMFPSLLRDGRQKP